MRGVEIREQVQVNFLRVLFYFLLALPSSLTRYQTCSWFYRGNPEDCNTYFQCNHGAPLLRNCPDGLYWNIDIGNCDWPNKVRSGVGQDCRDPRIHPQQEFQPGTGSDDGFDSSNNGVGESGSEDTVIIEPAARSKCQDGSFSLNPSDCSTFFVCNHGSLRLQQCGPGLHWNPSLTTCDWPSSARCKNGGGGGSNPSIPQLPPTTDRPIRPVETPSTTRAPWRPIATDSPIVTSPSRPIGQPTPAPTPTSPSFGGDGPKVICYFTDWAWYRPGTGKFMPKDIDSSLCTHVVYAFAIVDANNWTIVSPDSWTDIDSKFYEQVTALKKRGLKVTLALGGWNDSGGNKYSRLVNDPAKRASFIASVVKYLDSNNFDGLDLDWEYPKCWQGDCDAGPDSDKNGFSALVMELRAALPRAIISAAVSANKNVIDLAYDVPKLAQYMDWIGVMTYDYHGGWERQTGHIAPLYFNPGDSLDYLNVNYTINYFIAKGAPPSKLVMGIPLYGQSFTLANAGNNGLYAPATGPGTAGAFTRQNGILSYYEICSQQFSIVQNPRGTMGPYGVSGRQWVSFDDVPMVQKKSEYIKSMGLGGGMIWALDFDDFTGSCGQGRYPLLTAISSTLNKKKSSRPFRPWP